MTRTHTKYNFKNLLVTFWFFLCLIPVSNSQGISINYIYIFSLVILPFLGYGIKIPCKKIILIISIYINIFILSLLYQQDLFIDRAISFFVFMAVFTFCFIRTENLLVNFFDAIILASIYLALSSILTYISNEGYNLGFDGKTLFGSSRIGFIYIFALWLILYDKKLTFITLNYILIILIGCLLTFNRTTLLGLIGSALVWTVFNYKDIRFKYIFSVFTIFFALFTIFEDIYLLLTRDMIELALDQNRINLNLSDRNSSEGARLEMWIKALDYIFDHPWLGSGFLGFRILEESGIGSAHSQYVDVFFRVGFLGFFIWLYLIYKIIEATYKKFPGLFYGFIGALFFGIFNETFKLSQGSFIFAFLIGIYSDRCSYKLRFRNTL